MLRLEDLYIQGPDFDVEVGYKLPRRASHGRNVAEAYTSSEFSPGMATDLYGKQERVQTRALNSEAIRKVKEHPYLAEFLKRAKHVEEFEHENGHGLHVVTEDNSHLYVYMRPKKEGLQVKAQSLAWLLEQTRQAALLHTRAGEVEGILHILRTSR